MIRTFRAAAPISLTIVMTLLEPPDLCAPRSLRFRRSPWSGISPRRRRAGRTPRLHRGAPRTFISVAARCNCQHHLLLRFLGGRTIQELGVGGARGVRRRCADSCRAHRGEWSPGFFVGIGLQKLRMVRRDQRVDLREWKSEMPPLMLASAASWDFDDRALQRSRSKAEELRLAATLAAMAMPAKGNEAKIG